MKVSIKRIYEPVTATDGYRILVDRLWPRGIKKEDAHINKWLKDIAPSAALRKWFNHEADKWEQFKIKYAGEIKASPVLDELRADVSKHKTVTLLYAAKNQQYNQAAALLDML
jgi:uncharacterized protein YeaO (DUF488 family)